MLTHVYNIIIDHGVGSPGHVREVVDGLNANEKHCISMLMTTAQLPCSATYES